MIVEKGKKGFPTIPSYFLTLTPNLLVFSSEDTGSRRNYQVKIKEEMDSLCQFNIDKADFNDDDGIWEVMLYPKCNKGKGRNRNSNSRDRDRGRDRNKRR